jgi:hypothetical protein
VEILTWSCLTETTAYLYPAPHTVYLCYEKCVCPLGSNYYRRFCLNGPNNREIRQSRLSASGHGFEPENCRIQSRVYTVFLVPIFV